MTRPTPYPHQIVGARFLAGHEGGCLFDQVGTGKTLTAILAADTAELRHVLVLCPSVVKRHWERSFREWQFIERPVTVVDGFVKQLYPQGVVIASHAALTKPASHMALVRSGPWDGIVIDECDEFRNIQSKKAQALFGQMPWSLWRHSRYTWPLTGTPYVNSAADYYPIMSSILARRLGVVPSYYEFCKRYASVMLDDYGGFTAKGLQNEAELWAALAPHMLARRDVVELPPLRVETYPVDVPEEGLREITLALRGLSRAQIERALENEQEDDESISRVRHALGLAKVGAAAGYIEHLIQQQAGPVVAFFIHTDVMDGIRTRLDSRYRVEYLDGRNSSDAQAISDRFQAGGADVLLIQIKAGGVGITLTRANRCVVVEQPWTAKDIEQAIARLHRISQTRPVLAEVLYATGCWLDELAARLIAEKGRAAAYMLGHT